MKPISRCFIIFTLLVSLLLSACWDQRLLRDHSLVLSIGYDLAEENHIKSTVTFPKNTNEITDIEQASGTDNSRLTATGSTVKDAEKNMDTHISQKFDRSKARVLVFGKELAEDGIFSTLDSVYRDLRGPLNANIAIYDGEAEDALHIKSEQAPLVSDIYAELLESAEQAGITKNENVQMACPVMLADGKDVTLPYLSVDEDQNEATIQGLALFKNDKMTGTLNTKETTMFLILSKQLEKYTELNLKVHDDKEDLNKEFINISIKKDKRKLDINVENKEIQVKIHSTLNVEIDEYADDHLNDLDKVDKLENKIEEKLEELANETITKMQEANSDILGLGQKVSAYHHDTWENIDWIKAYPDIDIEADFDVDIYRHGIIN